MISFFNRKGEATGSSIIFPIFLLLVVVIGGGIYGGTIAFFGKGYDYRDTESSQLLKNVRDCLQDEKSDISFVNKDAFFEKCGISKEIIEDGKHLIYVKQGVNELTLGVADFKNRCGLYSRFKNKDYPICSEFKDGDNFILVGSSQNSRRVAA